MQQKRRFERFIEYFSKQMPAPDTELDYRNPFELLVATVLAAQCTDKRVNTVTPNLFAAFPSPQMMARATADDIFPYISSISYPNNKARHLEAMAKKMVSDHGGKVPSERKALESLPGVGRKTANVILAVAFKIPAMPVDTHVQRVSSRIGLTQNAKTPKETEKQLLKNIPDQYLIDAHHWILLHGRYICKARAPLCHRCPITPLCQYREHNS